MIKSMTVILILICLVPLRQAVGQGIIYLSNVDATSVGGVSLASNAWIAQSFRTGSSSGGYLLNSVELAMESATGTPGGFTIALYGPFGNGTPGGTYLGSLTSPTNPSAAGLFVYSAASITLSPSSTYWLLLAANTPLANGAYHLNTASFFDYSSTGGWSMDRYYETSVNGINWADGPTGYDVQFAINAASVPEPQTLVEIFLGSGVLFYVRTRGKKHSAPAL